MVSCSIVLSRPDLKRQLTRGESGKRNLLMVPVGPIWALWVGLFMMEIAIDRGIFWGHYLIVGR